MEIKEKITLDRLTTDSVSILKQLYTTINGKEVKVGENIRNAFMNTATERENLRDVLPADYYNAVMAVWGDTPTVAEPAEVS